LEGVIYINIDLKKEKRRKSIASTLSGILSVVKSISEFSTPKKCVISDVIKIRKREKS
jgi:hypothetical protein